MAAYCKDLHFLVLKNFKMVEKGVFFHDAKEFIDVACSIRMGEMETKELRSKVFFFPHNSYVYLFRINYFHILNGLENNNVKIKSQRKTTITFYRYLFQISCCFYILRIIIVYMILYIAFITTYFDQFSVT